MISLVRLEIQKLFRRKFVLVLLLIYGVVLLFMIYAGNPNRFSFDSDFRGRCAKRQGSSSV